MTSKSKKPSSSSSSTSSSSQGGEYDIANRTPLDQGEVEYVAPIYDTYYNYIEVYDDKGRVCRIGDPYILKYNGEYYLYTSCTGHLLRVGIPC